MLSFHDNDDAPTDDERQWALDIKYAAASSPHLNSDKLSDLEYLQFAIVTKGDTSKALSRIQRMQAFKKECGLALDDGSIEQARRDLKTFYTVHHGCYLALGALPDGTHVVCSDYHQGVDYVGKGESFKIRMRGLFYHLHACQPNITAMRAGFCTLLDFQNTTWKDFHVRRQRKVTELISKTYPIRCKQMVLLNVNAIVVAFWRIVRFFLPLKIRERTVLCANHAEFFQASTTLYPPNVLPTFLGGTFDSSPSVIQRVVEQKLDERYSRQANFKLLENEDKDDEDTATSVSST